MWCFIAASSEFIAVFGWLIAAGATAAEFFAEAMFKSR